MLTNGAMIADRYRLHRLIATGGMGQVWEALDTRLDRRVAVKVLKAEFSADPTFRHRFRTEAKTTAQLNHPGIAGIYDYGETFDPSGGETAYLVMELVQGEPLNAVLSRLGRLSVAQGLDMLEQTGRALEVAHAAGVVHRDVKPGNILVTPTGQVKITDFGIAKAVDASPVTKTGMVMGTAQYIAPEQATGEDATSASDVYSLGVVGYEALAGQRPFTGDGALTVAMKHVRDTPPPMPADLPANVRELIEITMTKDPSRRYRSGGEFADAVAAVRSGRRPPVPGGMGNTPTGAARVLPPTGATTVIPRNDYDRYQPPGRNQPPMGATSVMPNRSATPPGGGGYDPGPRFTNGQKALAGVAVGAILIGIVLWLLLQGSSKPAPQTPFRPSTSLSVPPTTTAAPTTTLTTTTEDDTPTRQAPPPPVTTTQDTPTTTPAPTTTTTTAPTTTTRGRPTSPTTSGRAGIPGIDIPSVPSIPGAHGTSGNGNSSGNQNDHTSVPATASQGLP
ncbi:protein kinase domain-containing protein [Nocardia aurantia]|uniref:non-specific serine/threonine protein kinase n=1 Tax=Nocardia aurantia TaxID=2585199 RepID=A0A7K0DN04_9NOCA|nr:protein kinase [Nocardia aurantia]MQY26988.1 Serine/threonine-protein kinase PknD [Nocardia aurantia]